MVKKAFVFFALLLFCVTSFVFAQKAYSSSGDRYIVVFDQTLSDPDAASKELAQTHGLKLGHTYKAALKGFSAQIPVGRLEALKKDKRVRYVAEDRKVGIVAPRKPPGRKPTPTPTPTPTFTPTPTPLTRWITVVTPNGGEVLEVGRTYRITWNSSSTIDKVSLGYKSCPSCLDWIVTNYPNTGFYDWNVFVGNTVNTQFTIDITGYQTGYGSANDQSDAAFTVLQPTPIPTATPTITPTRTPTPTPTPTIAPVSQTVPYGVQRIRRNPANTGSGVAVAVLDTGIDLTHPDLASHIVANTSCIPAASNGNDDHGHGSHVAGTIAALDNNLGVVGVAPSANLVAVKVLDSGGWGYWSEIICGIDWITANAPLYNIKVANMSLGGGGTSDNNCGYSNNDPLHQAICRSAAQGITYVVSAGNNSVNAATAVPAAYDDAVITVSALADSDGKPGGLGSATSYGPDDTFASFSNFGTVVDFAAPGVTIRSTYKNGGYTWMSGTSMASPHVAGVAALYRETHPTASLSEVRDALLSFAEVLGSGHTDPSGLHPEPVVQTQ